MWSWRFTISPKLIIIKISIFFSVQVNKTQGGLIAYCSGERDVVLHVPYLEISDRDQMSSTFTEFHAGSSIRHGGFCQSK